MSPQAQANSKPNASLINRQKRLSEALRQASLDGLVLNAGPSLLYLTGLNFHLSERPVLAVFTPDKDPVLVLPELEKAKLEMVGYPLQALPYGEDPATWAISFQQAVRAAGLGAHTVGLEPRRLRVLELRFLEAAAPQAKLTSAEDLLASLRMFKDFGEVAAMRKAVEIAQNALQALLPEILSGRTEREIATDLTLQLLRAGSDSEFPFTPIVSGGPNSANPHSFPSDRPLQPGDLLVIDWGASYYGYFSDLTRTFAIGEVNPELKRVAEVVLEANTAGRQACRPGVTAASVDRAARAVIEKAGYGPYFHHRTGHGLGMEVHEEPYIRGDNSLVLQPGMTFTVEPGIYLTGRNGVRIEDNVVITEQGVETLSNLPRAMLTLPA